MKDEWSAAEETGKEDRGRRIWENVDNQMVEKQIKPHQQW